jgi:hypothetical protein
LNAIFGLQTDCAGSGDSYYPVRAFPLWRQLVCTLGGLNAPKDKVAFLKAPGMNPAAMVATQGLLIACSTHSSPETVLLKEHGIVMPVLLLLYFIIGKYLR